ncbi:MAG: YdcF family protein [Eubacterium sp.]|nr:YdcF family protein [Eubacterium sp.]
MKKFLKFMFIILLVLAVLIAGVFGISALVNRSAADRILTVEEAAGLLDVDCILVLGCGVYEDGSPTPMLRDRLELAEKVYESSNVPKFLMSGDHGKINYNEVRTMRLYILDKGEALSEDIFMDHAGFSTYESIYRARDVFGVKKMIIITQTYHLGRALYIAKRLGVEAYGVGCEDTYAGNDYRSLREIFARDKDFLKCIFKPKPTYLGDAIDIKGDGNVTDDENVSNPNGAVVGISIHMTGSEQGFNKYYRVFEEDGKYIFVYKDEYSDSVGEQHFELDERSYRKIVTYDYAKVIEDFDESMLEGDDITYYDTTIVYENGKEETTQASMFCITYMLEKLMR